jgi:L,D-transpeptidase YcbB
MQVSTQSVRFVVFGLALLSAIGCRERHEDDAAGDVAYTWQPPKVETVAGVPAAAIAAAIQQRLDGERPDGLDAELWKHVKRLYKEYQGAALWMEQAGPIRERTSALLEALADAPSDALILDEYPIAALVQSVRTVREAKPPSAEELATADVLLSSAYLALAEDLLSGQTDPRTVTKDWHIDEQHERLDSAVVHSLRADRLDRGLARMRPRDAEYEALRSALVQMREVVGRGGWSPVPEGKQLRRGDRESPERLAALRARLVAEGIEVGSDSATGVYGEALAGAVASFQSRHSIGVDSMLGEETLNSLNVPAEFRLGQIAANLERHRWMPRSLGQRYVLVNVPAFRLEAFDSTGKALEMKVIVGEEYDGRTTPVFSDRMEMVVFRPYWNVTPTIQRKEIAPKVARDPSYLARNNMEYFRDGGETRIRQRPGSKNSLGLVKFLFPNSFNIYLHDTPQDNLFDKDVRAFSHGCIRLEKPAELAQWVLGWDADRVQTAMEDGSNNRTVTLPKKIPVYITYFTAFTRDGTLHFGNDLYARDEQLVEARRAGALPSEESTRRLDELRSLIGD